MLRLPHPVVTRACMLAPAVCRPIALPTPTRAQAVRRAIPVDEKRRTTVCDARRVRVLWASALLVSLVRSQGGGCLL